MKIVADNKIPFLKGIPEKFADITYLPTKDFTHENIKDADVLIIRTPNKCTRELLEGSKVRFIASTTIGYDHIDIDYCREANIKWVNSPGCNAVSVGQYMLSSLIELSRKKGFSLREKTLGIIGVGNVGKQVESVCKAYGINYLLCDPPRALVEGKDHFVEMDMIVRQCDIITFHVPLTKSGDHATYHLADQAFFNSLKKKPYLINAARGSVHDTKALIDAKNTGLIEEMVIDCWENEPEISSDLLNECCIATPHIAGFSADGKANGTRMCLEAIAREYNIQIKDLDLLTTPQPPADPVIDLNLFKYNRVENAILKTFSPLPEDKRLRDSPEKFEYLRTNYDNPREFHAYTIINSKPEESGILSDLGFKVS